jgi:hypothetical protein
MLTIRTWDIHRKKHLREPHTGELAVPRSTQKGDMEAHHTFSKKDMNHTFSKYI